MPTSLTGIDEENLSRTFTAFAAIFFTGSHYICLVREDVSDGSADACFLLFDDGKEPTRHKFAEFLALPTRSAQVSSVIYVSPPEQADPREDDFLEQ